MAEQMEPQNNKMGRWGATSYIVGNIVGSGIFITPTSILNKTNSVGLSLIVWLLSAAATILGAYCYVELGTSIRRSGCDFAYLSHIKWHSIAFIFMSVGCIISYPLILAVQASTFAEYMVQGLGLEMDAQTFGGMALRKLIAFSTIWLLLFLNFFSIRVVVAPFQMLTSVAKLLSALLIVGIGAYRALIKGATENLNDPFANSTLETAALANAFFAGLFNYEGWDILNMGAEELVNPVSTMSFAILVGMSCVATIYITINLAFFIVLPVPVIQAANAVAIEFALRTMGGFWRLMPLIITLVLLNAMNGSLFAASRYLYAASRQRQLPAFLSCINEKHDSPRAALLVHVILMFIFSFLGNTDQLIGYLGFAQWFQRGITMCVLFYIRFAKLPVHPGAIRVPLIMPFLFMLICFSLTIVTIVQDFGTAVVGLFVLACALLVYGIFIWERALPRFECYRTRVNALNDYLAQAAQIALNGHIQVDDEETESVHGDEALKEPKQCNKIWPFQEGKKGE